MKLIILGYPAKPHKDLSKEEELYTISLKMELLDFLGRGGFRFKEDIFQAQYSIIIEEADKLSKSGLTFEVKPLVDAVNTLAFGMTIYQSILKF